MADDPPGAQEHDLPSISARFTEGHPNVRYCDQFSRSIHLSSNHGATRAIACTVFGTLKKSEARFLLVHNVKRSLWRINRAVNVKKMVSPRPISGRTPPVDFGLVETKPSEPPPAPVSLWKRLIIRALAWGVGCGLAISVVLLSVYFYAQRPKGWDTGSLRVKNIKAEGLFLMDEKLAVKSTGTMFTVDLENTTGADITLPQTLTVMQEAKATGALHGSLLKLDKEYFLPAYHVVSIRLDNDDLCAAKADPQTCFNSYFKDEAQLVIFDETRRYEVRIPIPAFTTPRAGTAHQ